MSESNNKIMLVCVYKQGEKEIKSKRDKTT